jgi:uncharacterized protein with PIN domain
MPEFNFHGELLDFLPAALRHRPLVAPIAAHQTAKHAIEALGIPHTEVAAMRVDGQPAILDNRLPPLACVDVYPYANRLASEGSSTLCFIADAHLGRLARHLRFAGLDTLWENGWDDAALAACAEREERIVLTRDRALLMRANIHCGCHIRASDPLAQLARVAQRYGLCLAAGPASRCLECNAQPEPLPKSQIADKLPPRICAAFDAFWRCPDCQRIYWRGSHWQRMREALIAVDREMGL